MGKAIFFSCPDNGPAEKILKKIEGSYINNYDSVSDFEYSIRCFQKEGLLSSTQIKANIQFIQDNFIRETSVEKLIEETKFLLQGIK